MGFGLALGGGFFNELNKQADKVQDNDLATQRQLMQTWSTTVLPQVMKQRAADDGYMDQVNTLLGTKQFQDNPMMAFHAVKMTAAGAVKSPQDYLDQVSNGRIALPQDAKDAQLQSLQNQGLSYQKDDQGNISGITYKPQANPGQAASIPGANQNNGLASIFKSNPAASAQKAANQFTAASGVDPTQGVSSRFGKINTGNLGMDLKSPKAEKIQEKATDVMLSNPSFSEDYSKLVQAASSGDIDKVTTLVQQPGFIRSRETIENDQFNKQFKLNMAEHLGEFKNPGAVGNILMNGKASSADIMKVVAANTYTKPEQDAIKLQLAITEKAFGDLSNDDAVLNLNAAGVLPMLAKKGLINSQAIPGLVTQAQKNHDDRVNFMQMQMKTMFPQGIGSGPANTGMQSKAMPQATPTTQAPTQAPPQQEAPQPKDAGGDTGNNAVPLPGITPTGDGKKAPRVGDPAGGAGIPFAYDGTIQSQIENATPEFVQHVNPFTAIQSAQHMLSTKASTSKVANVVRNITFTDDDRKLLQSTPKLQDMLKTTVQGQVGSVTYNSVEDAAKKAPVGGLYYVKGMPSVNFMTQAIKDKFTTKE